MSNPAMVFVRQAGFAEPQCTAVGPVIANVSAVARTGVIIGREDAVELE